MRQLLAVVFQLTIAASNYGILIAFAHTLPDSDFLLLTSAVGINMIAYAIAEGGISYTAPKETSILQKKNRARLSSAYISISIGLYFTTLTLAYLSWNLFSQSNASLTWLIAYISAFAPTLISPAWLIQDGITIKLTFAHGIARAIPIALILHTPTKQSLLIGGLACIGFSTAMTLNLTRKRDLLAIPTPQDFKHAAASLKSVFASKTISFALVGSIPLMINIYCGTNASSIYILGERLRSLYVSITQPITQTLFLYLCRNPKIKRAPITIILQISNLALTTACLLSCEEIDASLTDGKLGAAAYLYILAGGIATANSITILVHVLPNRLYHLFSKSTLVQSTALLAIFASLHTTSKPSPNLILPTIEAIFLVAISILFLTSKQQPTAQKLEEK